MTARVLEKGQIREGSNLGILIASGSVCANRVSDLV